jgi:tRNA(Arg) A34 adenosine deaminase TadA
MKFLATCNTNTIGKLISFSILLPFLWSCSNSINKKNKTTIDKPMYSVTNPVQIEIDEIFSLLAYSIVYADWQEDSIPRNDRRGYNIGSVLVNSENKPVYYALNCVGETNNSTQHSEVRLITQYLDSVSSFDLKNFTIYTTLEPCAMCAGMMTMTLVTRTVYGQNDVEFSHTFERLAIDSRSIGGYPPFPRKVIADESPSIIKQELNDAYQEFLKTDDEKILAKFLVSKKAKEIYKKACLSFKDYKVKFSENENIYAQSITFYNEIVNSKKLK